MQKSIKLQRAMTVNNRFTYALLERHTRLSRSFIRKKISEYKDAGLISQVGLGAKREKLWRLTQEGKRRFDPKAPELPVAKHLKKGRNKKLLQQGRPEQLLWEEIKRFKTFTFRDLTALNLAGESMIRQYLALLKRAGILSAEIIKGQKKQAKEGRYPKRYTLTKKAGAKAPVFIRSFYIYDPNTGEYHTTAPVKF